MKVNESSSTVMKPSVVRGLVADRDSWIALNKWLDQIGTSSVTAWRWRRRGWLKVVNVGGRLFLRPEDLAEFELRAVAGEFSKSPTHTAISAAVSDGEGIA